MEYFKQRVTGVTDDNERTEKIAARCILKNLSGH